MQEQTINSLNEIVERFTRAHVGLYLNVFIPK